MQAHWLRRFAVVVTMALIAYVASAAGARPSWTTKVPAGSVVLVTLTSDVVFDAIWMGPDGDRAVFERFGPDETISLPFEAVRKVSRRRGPSSSKSQAYGTLGAAVGFWGAFGVLYIMLRGM